MARRFRKTQRPIEDATPPAEATGRTAPDPAPFNWLETIGTLLALYITVLILITQRRENELTQRREQLTLELSVLAEQKTAKIIELLEELRRDHPDIQDRVDAQAEEMAEHADPHAVLAAIGTLTPRGWTISLRRLPRRPLRVAPTRNDGAARGTTGYRATGPWPPAAAPPLRADHRTAS